MTKEEKREALKELRFNNEGYNIRNWTDDDRRKLKDMYNNGIDLSDIALELGRTERAINQELYHSNCFPRKRKIYRKRVHMTGCLCSQCGVKEECGEE